jgi:hypothetical protein
MENINNLLKQSILTSQHCQRNWDLSKNISDEDLSTLISAVTECPSKQNIAYYKCHFITNRSMIEEIYSNTEGFYFSYDPPIPHKNTQTLANLVVAFEEIPVPHLQLSGIIGHDDIPFTYVMEDAFPPVLQRDKEMAIGIASGYLNLTANILGYSTGYCACFDPSVMGNVIGTNNNISLLLGIGFKNDNMKRRQHHLLPELVYSQLTKQPIEVSFVD